MLLLTVILYPTPNLYLLLCYKLFIFFCIKKIRITPSHLTKTMKNIHKCTQVYIYKNSNRCIYAIPLVKNTWHAVTFPILLRNLTFTWNSFGQEHMTCCYISQKFDNYMKFFWSQCTIMTKILTFTWDSQLFSYVKRCIICKKRGSRLMERG